ncbi:MAG: acylphosphatase [Candidatus Acidiferrum sp.]
MQKEELQARRFVVTGRVHGVGFRNYAEHVAGKIGVQGYVRNRENGSVEVLAMGNMEQLGQMREALQKGPAMSRVSGVTEVPDQVDRNYLGQFSIEYTI